MTELSRGFAGILFEKDTDEARLSAYFSKITAWSSALTTSNFRNGPPEKTPYVHIFGVHVPQWARILYRLFGVGLGVMAMQANEHANKIFKTLVRLALS